MKKKIASLALALAITPGFAQLEELLEKEISGNIEEHEELYRHFHMNPELSLKEIHTAASLSLEMEKLGFDVTRNFSGNSFVSVLENGEGPVIMLRTDMDALPVDEKTGLSYASKVPGVMHACGHDMHMTVWFGTAKVLSSMKKEWKGTLIMVAQQAEEKSGGASLILRDGLYSEFPVPDYALAYHVNPALPAGTIGYRQGPFMAGVSSVDIRVHGVGGHGAIPQATIDPVVLASRMVLAFQTITSREISPLQPAVVTVGSIHGGTVHNIIPDEVNMQLTVRFYDDGVYEKILAGLRRISDGIAQSAGLSKELYPEVVATDDPIPPVINNEDLVKKAFQSMAELLGEENLVKVDPVTAGEDFAYYGRTEEKVPAAMFWLGVAENKKYEEHLQTGIPLPSLHSPLFYPDFKPSYTTGVLGMSKTVIDLFNGK